MLPPEGVDVLKVGHHGSRTSTCRELLDAAAAQELDALPLQGKTDWSGASRFGASDSQVAKPMTGWAKGYYTIDNGDGTVSVLVVGSDAITVERFNADGSLSSSKTIEKELPTFGAFLDSGNHFYLAFGQDNDKEEDGREVWRIVRYDREWNRLGSASVNGGDSYTTAPFTAAVSRMAVSGDGKTLALHAAHMAEVMGVEHVACGFDFCEFMGPGNDAAAGLEDCGQTPRLFDWLERLGMTAAEREQIARGNFLRILDKAKK